MMVTAILFAASAHAWELSAADKAQVWKIGTDHTQPYHFVRMVNGQPQAQGMVAELVQLAARRLGLQLVWQSRLEGPVPALTRGAVDLWPLISVNLSSPQLHVSRPYLRNVFIYLSTDQRFVQGREQRGLVKRVALSGHQLARAYAKQTFPQAEFVPRPHREAAFQALCAGQADVVFVEARTAQHIALQPPPGCEGRSFYPAGSDTPIVELGVAATPAAAHIADCIRDEIDEMLADGTAAAQLRAWNYYYAGEAELIYKEHEAQATTRVVWALASALSLLAVLLLAMLLRVRRARVAAVAADEAKSRFLANMSHELRTPLTGVLGISEILARSPLSPEQTRMVAMLRNSGETLLTILNDVLDLARAGRGDFQLQLRAFAPAELFADTLGPFQLTAQQRGIQLHMEGLEGLPPALLGDPVRVRQILVNLVGNAMKFTQAGSVTVRFQVILADATPQLEISVADTGIGISPEAQRRLFEKFYQADSSITRRFGGTGLGLAIVKDLVKAMQGTVSVESQPGKGSVFTVRLPLPIADPSQLPASPAPGESKNMEAPAAPARILLVEDNPINEHIVRTMIQRAGHQVASVSDGLKALEQHQQQRFDAILMDCQMPVMDGFQSTSEIRKRENGQHTPIIALTASAMQGERERCLAAGMDDFLSKPVDLTELNRVLKQWLPPGTRESKGPDVAHRPS